MAAASSRDLPAEQLSGTCALRDLPTLDPHERARYVNLRNDRLGDRVRMEQERVTHELLDKVIFALHRRAWRMHHSCNVTNLVKCGAMNVVECNQLYLKGNFLREGLFPQLEMAPASGFCNWDFGLAELQRGAGIVVIRGPR